MVYMLKNKITPRAKTRKKLTRDFMLGRTSLTPSVDTK